MVPSARCGGTILGIDISEPRLEICRGKLEAEPADVRNRASVRLGNVLNFDLGVEYGIVTMPFRGFQDLTSADEERQALQNIRRHLRDEGRLVLDVFNPSIPFLADESVMREFVDGSFSLTEQEMKIRLAVSSCSPRLFFADTIRRRGDICGRPWCQTSTAGATI